MTTLIGFRCKRRKTLSREVLIDRMFPLRKEGEELESRNNLWFTSLRVVYTLQVWFFWILIFLICNVRYR